MAIPAMVGVPNAVTGELEWRQATPLSSAEDDAARLAASTYVSAHRDEKRRGRRGRRRSEEEREREEELGRGSVCRLWPVFL